MRPLPPRVLLLRAFSLLVAAASLICGGREIARDWYRFEGPPHRVLHPQFDAELRTVLRQLPVGARVLHFSAVPEYWYSRLWQRALYPRNDVILVQPPLSRKRFESLRRRYGARYAISYGVPPWDPGFLWKTNLGPLPLVEGDNWFGELAP